MVREVLVHFGLQVVWEQKREGCKIKTIRTLSHSLMFVGISFSFDTYHLSNYTLCRRRPQCVEQIFA